MTFVVLGLLSILSTSNGMELEDFLNKVTKDSNELRAIEVRMQAASSEIRARDLTLVSELSLEGRQVWDDRVSTEGLATFTKGLPTGTQLSISGAYDLTEGSSPASEFHRLNWAAEIKQSLWRDMFGMGTRLRQKYDRYELLSRHAQFEFTKAEKLLSFENLFWDFVLVEQEIRALATNLEKSRKSASWIKKRMERSAAERTDMLQAQSQVSRRELELQEALDFKENLVLRLKQINSSGDWISTWIPSEVQASQMRSMNDLVSGSKAKNSRAIRSDVLAGIYLARSLEQRAQVVSNEHRPDLNVFAGAGTNAVKFDRRYAEVGLQLSLDLNFSLKSHAVRSARQFSEAQQIQSVYQLRESSLEWEDLQRNLDRLNKRLEIASQLASLQKQKSAEERRRYEQGRSTAFQSISFEQEAIEAQLHARRLQVQLRKEEARARLFAWSDEESLH